MGVQYKTYPVMIGEASVMSAISPFGATKSAEELSYEKDVTSTLETINNSAVGRSFFNSLPFDKSIYIIPYSWLLTTVVGKCNAVGGESQALLLENGDARVSFSPTTWNSGQCYPNGIGASGDEVLLHELLHAYRAVRGTCDWTSLHKPEKMYGNIEELFAIVITNIYISEKGKTKFRRDHTGFQELPAKWATSEGFISDKDYYYWIENFWFKEPQLTGLIATVNAPFNPFRAFKEKFADRIQRLKYGRHDLNLNR